jgi:DHA2 family multidrug resistance protein-like MFS transporter
MAEAPQITFAHPDGMAAGWPRRLAVATITIGLMMSVFSNSMTNLALPYIAQDLKISAESSIWIVNATQIALVVSLLPVAALADIVGYRHIYRFGLVLFSLASIGCAFAPSLPWLLLGRTFQGLGGAAIMSVQPALVRAIYPRNMLGRGLGFNTTVVATSLAAGPSIGAALLSITSWPILFAVYAPLGIISFVLSERYLPHTTHTHRPFDVISAILSGLTFGLLIFGIDGMAHGHQRPVIATELILALVLGTLFVWRQKTLADPMMPIDVFKRPIFSLSISAAMPSSACRSTSTPCWARAPATPASC